MGYWKREYTERKGGRPLFQAESKGEDASSERREEDRTDPPSPPDQPSSDSPAASG